MQFVLIFIILFVSCSRDVFFDETLPNITLDILNNSSGKTDTILNGSIVLLELKDTLNLQAKLNPSVLDIKEFYWLLNSDTLIQKVQQSNLKELYEETGIYDVKFYAIDFYNDTISSNFYVYVSNAPVCNNLRLQVIQGSSFFEWNCSDLDNDSLTYTFLLKDKNNKAIPLRDTAYGESFLIIGNALPNDYWSFNIKATDSYGFSTTLDYVWSAL